jgi:putative membrane protein
MKKHFILLAFALSSLFACNNNHPDDPVDTAKDANEEKDKADNVNAADEKDAQFLVEAASGGMMEVTLGEAAKTRSQNEKVKSFGAMMVRDHTKANEELKTLAAAKNITIPVSMGEDHQDMVNKMMENTGAEFDKKYMDMMVEDHKEDVAKFDKASTDCKDAEIQAFASRTLPVLRTHLDSAIVINDGLRK